MNSPEKLSSAGTTPNKQVRGADRPSDHRGWPPEQPWLKVRTGVAKSPDTCGSHAGIYTCLIGIIAAILFFIERDCDTSKNLRTIPVTNTQLIMAKISMLFIFSIAFCLTSTLSVALFCKLFHVGMVYGMTYKIFMSLIFGVLIVAASLPIVFLIIYFNQSFLLSILLAFFYSIFNWGILGTIGTSISDAKIAFLNSFPVICVMNWTSGSMMNHLQKDNLLPEAYAIVPTTFHTIFIMVITVILSLWLIIRFYKKWTR